MSEGQKNKYWCPLPWMSLSIRNNGSYRVCCHAGSTKRKGTLVDPDGTTLDVFNSSISNARNSLALNELRKSMLKNESHEMCKRCDVEDEVGLKSRRQVERKEWERILSFEKAKKITGVDGSFCESDMGLHAIDVRFGNKCNLKCVMCYPTESSAWWSDLHAVRGRDSYRDTHGPVYLLPNQQGKMVPFSGGENYKWYQNSSFFEQLKGYSETLESVYMAGGEPLIIDQHLKFLETAISSGSAANMALEYNTNGTVLPKKVLDCWKHFKKIMLGVSIDGVGPVNEYIRFPLKWDRFIKNLKTLDELKEESPEKYDIWMVPTIQAYNILHLPDFLTWKVKNFPDWGITMHPLHNSKELSLRIFPEKSKIEIEKHLLRFANEQLPQLFEAHYPNEDYSRKLEKLKKQIEGFVAFMKSGDDSDLISEFLGFTERLDKARHVSFRSALVGLEELLI